MKKKSLKCQILFHRQWLRQQHHGSIA